MKYYLKWVTIEEETYDIPVEPHDGSFLSQYMVGRTEKHVMYYKNTTSHIPQWIDCISRATAFDSLEAADKLLAMIINKNGNYEGFFEIEESISGDFDALQKL